MTASDIFAAVEANRPRRRHARILGAVVGGVLAASAVAVAAWLVGGGGEAYSRAGSLDDLTTASVTFNAADDLYPGDTGDAQIAIVNPNSTDVTVTDVTGAGAVTSDKGGCAGTNLTFTDQTGLALVVSANNGPAGDQFALVGSVALASTAPTECQGAVFTIPVSLAGEVGF